jgi:mRNA interferase MazF
MFQEGDIVVASLQQADGQRKLRPVLVLKIFHAPYNDIFVCGISSSTQQVVSDFDELLLPTDADYIESGVLQPSLIRLGFLATIPQSNIQKVIGSVSLERHKRLINRLCQYFLSSSSTL